MKIRLILHIHTNFSHDSYITPTEIISQCKEHNIKYIGLTDHCSAKGALKYKGQIEKQGIKVIVGEELKTQSGEIIGLFLSKHIDCKDNDKELIKLDKAIAEIRKQNALVLAPHPFDVTRLGIGRENLEKFRDKIDAYEIFNARTKINYFNKKAKQYVKENDLIPFIGSDAHIAREIPNAIIEMEDFKSKEEFLQNLMHTDTKFYKKRLKLIDIIRPTMNKIRKKLFG